MRLDEREQQLIALVETYQVEESRRLLEEAQQTARALLGDAYRGARRNLHQRVLAERQRARLRIEAAQAELATRERRAIEHLQSQLLEAAWPRLRSLLLERWQSRQGREAWVEGVARDALTRLPLKGWLITHPPELEGKEQERLRTWLVPQLTEPPGFAVDARLVAGVRILTGGAVLDGSLGGLLMDRRRLEARLLGLFTGGAVP